MTTTVSSIAFDASPKAPRNVEKLRELSIKLEATFLAEMLKVSEFGTPPKSMAAAPEKNSSVRFFVRPMPTKWPDQVESDWPKACLLPCQSL